MTQSCPARGNPLALLKCGSIRESNGVALFENVVQEKPSLKKEFDMMGNQGQSNSNKSSWFQTSTRSWALKALGAMVALSGLGCAQQNFSGTTAAGAAVTGTPGGTCTTTNVEAMYRQTKIIFLVDVSGSNSYPTANYGTTPNCGNGGACTPPTDPNKTFRHGQISDFLNRFAHKSNFDWSFATFAQDTSTSYINNGDAQSPLFTNDTTRMQTALTSFMAVSDYGDTPYGQALSMAQRAIANDPDKDVVSATGKPNYFVILLTDGFPTDLYNTDGSFNNSLMVSEVNALLQASPGQVNLSTISYGTANDQVAINVLKQMAAQGGGQFANVNDTTSSFKIDDVIPGSSTGCP